MKEASSILCLIMFFPSPYNCVCSPVLSCSFYVCSPNLYELVLSTPTPRGLPVSPKYKASHSHKSVSLGIQLQPYREVLQRNLPNMLGRPVNMRVKDSSQSNPMAILIFSNCHTCGMTMLPFIPIYYLSQRFCFYLLCVCVVSFCSLMYSCQTLPEMTASDCIIYILAIFYWIVMWQIFYVFTIYTVWCDLLSF